MKKKEFSEANRSQIRHWKKKVKKISLYKKLEVLEYASRGYKVKEIADLTNYSEKRITELIKKYQTEGIEYFLEEHRKGGNRRNLTDAQENEILDKYKEKAMAGKVINLREIKKEYERVLGREVANSTFYDYLNRQGWRRVMPRGAHPKKASDEEIETSKKLTT
jgi:transposase